MVASAISCLEDLGLGKHVVQGMAPADLMGLTGCAPDDASTIVMIAQSLPDPAPQKPPESLDAMPAVDLTDSAGAATATASRDTATASRPAVPSAAIGGGVASTGGGGRSAGGGGEAEELDPEVLKLLSTLQVSDRTVEQLARFGIGLGAMRLLSAADLVEMSGCEMDEAVCIVNGVTAADAAAAMAAQKSLSSRDVRAGLEGTNDALGPAADTPLTAEEVSAVLGYPIDNFQTRTLKVIVQPTHDLLAMAPTGSGKTAVALQAIMQAFRRGKKAIYTSPIKALSNQKYYEFKEWFAKRGLNAGVTLLTGDIKIRSPPGTARELIICTSEILRNKLVKAAGAESGGGAPAPPPPPPPPPGLAAAIAASATDGGDEDLRGLGSVISDEIHYINDVERGSVWEETLMHLPRDVQMVALSATLREPESFLNWISITRGRPGELVTRKDRHVPLHVGGMERKTGSFVEFFGTHGARAQTFEMDKYSALCTALKHPEGPDATTAAAAAAARGERANEKAAQREAFAGGGRGGGGRGKGGGGGGGKGGKGGRGGGGRGGAGGNHDMPSFNSECIKLGKALAATNKLPCIVFAMSRMRCVEGAHACAPLHLIGGAGGERTKQPADDAPEEEHIKWRRAEEARKASVRATQRALHAMHRQHLQRYMPELGELEAYRDIMALLERGVAYHHSGMLPVLREFVELCFQERLVKIVFATETLAVGVNMPARTVVFAQLDKPNDGDLPGHRKLRPDEFWQMAGRAGRRGMDELGFVIYAPTLGVKGTQHMASATEMRQMLLGEMPAATSQLTIDRPFVLRHLNRGYGPEVLKKTLLADQQRRQIEALQRELKGHSTGTSSSGGAGGAQGEGGADADRDALIEAAHKCVRLEAKLAGEAMGLEGVMLNPKQQKAIQAELRQLKDAYGEPLIEIRDKIAATEKLQKEIESMTGTLEQKWHEAVAWLTDFYFLDPPAEGEVVPKLSARGRAAAAFADGQPLILGTIISDRRLAPLSRAEICAFICLFLKDVRGGMDMSQCEIQPPKPSPAFEEVLQETEYLAECLEVELDRSLALQMLDWCTNKDITRIASWIDPALLGGFVKAVQRVASYVDVIREVLLGLGEYESYNQLDNHMDMLLGGVVTNESLYLRLVDGEAKK